jgi:hypothetical protein
MSDRALALVVVLGVLAPAALVALVALMRGYSITLVVERRARRPRHDDGEA